MVDKLRIQAQIQGRWEDVTVTEIITIVIVKDLAVQKEVDKPPKSPVPESTQIFNTKQATNKLA